VTIEQLDPRPALIVIDLQAGTLGNATVHPTAEIVAKSVELATAFRAHELPVVLASVVGSPAGRNGYGGGARDYPAEFAVLAPELKAEPTDILVSRRTWSAFAGTDLAEKLAALGVTQVVLAGVATSFGVESTARAAYDLGFSVVIAVDAITDLRIESHEATVARVFPVLSEIGTAAEIVAALG
jgi:nicotinamidase-related amidase